MELISFHYRQEVNAIWTECLSECRGIQFTLLNISSEDKSNIIDKIRETTQALSGNKLNSSVTLFLQFLSGLTFTKNSTEEGALEGLFSQCCEKQAHRICSHIGMFEYG